MSMMLMVKAMGMSVGNPLRKLVLLKLADNANDSGECWPSYQHIADQCEIARSTVRKHIKALEESGLLRIENRTGPKGNSSNVYHLTLQGVVPDSTGVVPDSTPPVVPDSTRTSHSFEPVNEPVTLEPAKSKKLSRFKPPTIEEVEQYCSERKNSINAETFVNHYKATGWKRGNTAIKDWKACVITWEKRDSKNNLLVKTASRIGAFPKL